MSLNNIEEILIPDISKQKKIINTKITNLVKLGENYGGELLKIQIETEEKTTHKKEYIHAVAKKIPADKQAQEIFNVQVTFNAELLFYKRIVPTLQAFQKECGIRDVIDCFAAYYGGRLNLNGSDIVDNDAVILLENLAVNGYRNIDRHIGYNLEETKILLRDLATLHSTAIALKIKRPNVFAYEIRPLCKNELKPVEDVDSSFLNIIYIVEEILKENEKCAPYVPQMMKIYKKLAVAQHLYKSREPFATLSHCDLWVNNAMMKYENGIPVKNVFIDFQLYSYKSPVIDLVQFLLTSVQTKVLQIHFDDIIKYYHSEFIFNLERLGCDTDKFLYDKFNEEMNIDAVQAFVCSILFAPLIVYANKGQPFTETDYDSSEFRNSFKENMSTACKEKLFYMVELFGNKNWFVEKY